MRKYKKTFCILSAVLISISVIRATKGKEPTAEQEKVTAVTENIISYAGVEEYEVGPFETLSHIAVKYIPSDDYMQQWIEDAQRLNGRKNSTIYFGEVIKVYVYEE